VEFNIDNFAKILVIVVSLLITSGCSRVNIEPIDKNKIELDVLDAFKGLVKASESFDTDRYFEFFDKERFTGLNVDGTVWHSFENFEALISSGFPMVERNLSLEFINVKVTVISPTTAILVNEYKHSMLLKSGDIVEQSGGGTQVWYKSNNVWKLVSVSGSVASH
jgi:hypothetical protein